MAHRGGFSLDDERIERLEAALADLALRVETLERELIDQGLRIGRWRSRDAAQGEAGEAVVQSPQGVLPLLGRTLLVLGGGFLLRAATDAGLLPAALGAGVGFVYGLTWIGMAWRTATSSRLSSYFHAIASALIVLPLVWEATVKFGYLTPPASAANLIAATGIAMVVAWRRDLPGVAWLFAAAGTPVAVLLAVSTKLWLPFVGIALMLCWGSLLLAYARRWYFLGTVGSAFADQVVLMITAMYVIGPGKAPLEGLTGAMVVALQLSLLLVYLGTFVVRTLARGHEIHNLEVVQAILVLILGLGGTVAVNRDHRAAMELLGSATLVAGVASYAVSFLFIDRDRGHRRNFIFYTTTALALTLVATIMLLEGSSRSWSLVAAALLTAALAGWKQRATLILHGAVFATAAAATSGLLATTTAVLRVHPASLEARDVAPWVATLATFALCATLRITGHRGTWGRFDRVPRAFCLALLMLGTGGMLVAAANGVFTSAAPGEIDTGAVAAVRTGLLSGFAVLLAWLSRRARYAEAAWLLYPMLVLAGIELVAGDLRVGRAGTLFVSLALYGSALILSPRLARRARGSEPRPPSSV